MTQTGLLVILAGLGCLLFFGWLWLRERVQMAPFSDYPPMPTFGSEREMYEDSEARRLSPEIDFGVHWKTKQHSTPFLSFRVSWIEATGELYVTRQGLTSAGPRVWIIQHFETREAVEAALEGWAEVCGERASLEWLLQKAVG